MLGIAALGAVAPRAWGLDPYTITSGGASIEISFQQGDFDAGLESVQKWVSNAALAVTTYFGKFPVPLTRVNIRPVPNRSGVFGATTFPDTPPRTRISVGQRTSWADLDDDWTLTHELTHLAFPNVPRQHHWMEEGLATYVEPVARVQSGNLTPQRIWADMVRDMPKGVPGPNGTGLDQSRTWANTYWGGAVFCLLADVQYRQRTRNRRGLQHALRGILHAGGNIQEEWPVTKAFEAADKAAGAPVLMELYDKMKDTAVQTDLPDLWRKLGIVPSGKTVEFRNDAEWSNIRQAITAKMK
jgi:hypothetical protein